MLSSGAAISIHLRRSKWHFAWREWNEGVRWVNNVALGKDDRSQTLTKAEFVEGGTVGPAAK